jgi:hypothetical protein
VLDPEAPNVGEHPRVAGAADDRNLQAETLSVREVVLNAFAQLFRVRELEFPLQIAGEQCVTVECLARQAFELLNRIEALVEGADVGKPVGDEQFLPVLLVDLAPGKVGPGLGVDEQPVEVEEQAADLVDGQLRWLVGDWRARGDGSGQARVRHRV